MEGSESRGGGAKPRARLPVFWIGFLVVLLARVLVAYSRLDDGRGEETYQGTLAWAWLNDFPLDREKLPIIVHLRGSVVFAALVAPLYALLGPSYAVLKIVAVVWSALVGGLVAFCVERGLPRTLPACARRRGALVAIALVALLPPAYQMVDTCTYGSHMDSVLPTLAALACVVAAPGALSWTRTIALGLALGFGTFFSLQCTVATPAVLLAWWASDRGFWRRPSSLGVLAAALPAACIPLVSRSSKLVTKSMGDHFLPEGLAGAWDKLVVWLSGDGVRVMLFEVSGGALLGWVFAAAALVALVLCVPRVLRLEPLAIFALGHPLLVWGAWVASDFELNFVVVGGGMGSRYLMPTMPAVAIALVLAGIALRRRGPGGLLASRLVVGSALVTGALGVVGLLDTRPLFQLPPRIGTTFSMFEMHFRVAGDWRTRLRLARELEPDWDAYRPVAYRILAPPGEILAPKDGLPTAREIATVAAMPEDERPYVLAAMGSAGAGPATLERVLGTLDALGPDTPREDARFLRLGVGRAITNVAVTRAFATLKMPAESFALLARLPDEHARDVAIGAGFQLGRLFVPYNDNFGLLLEGGAKLPDERRAAFFRGLGLGWRLRFQEAEWFVPEPGAAKLERRLGSRDAAEFRAALALPLTAWSE